MIVSEARLAANQRNAQLSTGPRTEAGKKVSRANALTHGLCASTVVPEDPSIVIDRTKDFFDTLRPQNHFHCWIVSEVALMTFKVDRAERMERRVRDKIAIKAEVCWDDDKRLEAELLGEQLANRPAVVVEQLRRTPQGCEWLMVRWALLAYSADKGAWTPEQKQLAFDLLATPADFRPGNEPGVSIDFRGNVILEADEPAAVARREIAELEARRDSVRGLDEINKALAMADLYDDTDAELKRLRKYEGTLHGRIRWCMRQLQESGPVREIPRYLKESWFGYGEPAKLAQAAKAKANPLPEPVAVQEPPAEWVGKKALVDSIHPPFELEPDEYPAPGQKADIPQILADRRVKKLKKAQARQEARRRKLDKLNA